MNVLGNAAAVVLTAAALLVIGLDHWFARTAAVVTVVVAAIILGMALENTHPSTTPRKDRDAPA